MAEFRDILLLVDKVSAPLRKIQENMRKTTNNSNKFKTKVQELSNKLTAFGQKTKQISANVQKFGQKISGIMSKIGLGVTGFTGAIGYAFNRLQGWLGQTAQYGDRIDKMSQKIGMGTKAFQEWDFIMSQNGGSVESLQMGYKTLANQMNGVQKGSKESIKAFQALGVKVKDNTGKFRTQDEVFNDVVRALQRETNATKKAILGNQLFGRSFIEMKPLLNQTAESIEELRKQAQDTIISDEDIQNSVKYTDAMDRLNRIFQAKMAPVVTRIMPKILEIMDKILKRSDILEKIIEVIVWLTDKIINLVDWFMGLSKGGKIAIGVFAGFLAVLGPIISFAGTLIGIVASLSGLLGVTAGAVVGATGAFLGWVAVFAGIIAGIWAIVEAVKALIGWLDHLNKMKINDINVNFNDEQLQKLSKLQDQMGADAFEAKYGKEVAQAVNKGRAADSYTKNDNRNYMSNSHNTTNNNTTVNNYNSIMPFGSPAYAK